MSAIDPIQFAADMKTAPIVAILRGIAPDTMIEVCEVLESCGVLFAEATMNSPEPLESVRRAARHFQGRRLRIGAGTVLSASEVDQVADAGGCFIVSPNFNAEVVRRTKERGLVSMPGFFTPSEAFAAVATGADFLKLFPANANGPGYIKDLKAVLPNPIVAVGGVNRENIKQYLAVAAGAGIGSALYAPGKPLDQIRADAEAYVEATK